MKRTVTPDEIEALFMANNPTLHYSTEAMPTQSFVWADQT